MVAATTGLLGLSSTKRAAVLAVVVCALALTVAVPLRNYVTQRQELAAVTEQQQALAAEVDELTRQRDRLADPAEIAAQARSRLGYVMPGEVPYVVQLPDRPQHRPRPRAPIRGRRGSGCCGARWRRGRSECGVTVGRLGRRRRRRGRAARAPASGRSARWRTVARAGCRRVVQTAPRLPDGTPFPTLYYLTCARLCSRIGGLESSGLMREMTERLAEDPELAAAYRRAHEAYLAERDAIEPLGTEVSAGGMPDRVKCLHVHAGTRWPSVRGSTRSATRPWPRSGSGGAPAPAQPPSPPPPRPLNCANGTFAQ